MIYLKSSAEISKMREAGRITACTFDVLKPYIKPGVTTFELDRIARDYIKNMGAEPSFLNYEGFPAAICASINDEVIHGIPSKRVLKEGDIISLDIGAKKDGFHGDAARTFAVGEISFKAKRLIEITEKSFFEGVKFAKSGERLYSISATIEDFVVQNGYSVVKHYCGHGIGKNLHEDPEVPNYGKFGRGCRLTGGMTIAVEPMVNFGADQTYVQDDDWTVVTSDGSLSAHYENTILITDGEPLILTQP